MMKIIINIEIPVLHNVEFGFLPDNNLNNGFLIDSVIGQKLDGVILFKGIRNDVIFVLGGF